MSSQSKSTSRASAKTGAANDELLLHGHGYSRRLIAHLVYRGLAEIHHEMVVAGGMGIEVARVRITAAGRRALARAKSKS